MTRSGLAAAILALLALGGCGEVASTTLATDSGAVEEPSSPAASSAAPGPRMVTGYYLGDGPRGVVLFREDRPVGEPDHGPAEAVGALSLPPLDPDYRTYWPPGAFLGAGGGAGVIELHLADDSLADRPEGMSPAEAELSIQQVVYTLQAYRGDDAPVRFLVGDRPVARLLGVPVSEAVTAAPPLETLSLMSLLSPAEGEVVEGSFRAEGLNNGYEGTASWLVLDHDGEEVAVGAAIGGSEHEDRLLPWHSRVDVAHLPPGTYTFFASTDEPRDGVDAHTDTRTIVVR